VDKVSANSTGVGSCPLCSPRPDDSRIWIKVCKLSVSTLYLDRNQTYRGHCQLIYDTAHVVGIESLPAQEFNSLMSDLRRAASAIARACNPDLMNYASMGNVVPHVHWHLVPRYKKDPRWGLPIYTTDLAEMRTTHLQEAEYGALIQALNQQLERRFAAEKQERSE